MRHGTGERIAVDGIAQIERLMTNSAWQYRFSLRHACAVHSIVQKSIRPHCLWQNGEGGRMRRCLTPRIPMTSGKTRQHPRGTGRRCRRSFRAGVQRT